MEQTKWSRKNGAEKKEQKKRSRKKGAEKKEQMKSSCKNDKEELKGTALLLYAFFIFSYPLYFRILCVFPRVVDVHRIHPEALRWIYIVFWGVSDREHFPGLKP